MKDLPAWDVISQILLALKPMVVPGVTPVAIDSRAEELIAEFGVKSFNKDYNPTWCHNHPYPASTCICRNFEIAHGIPNNEPLLNGDVVSIDLGIIDKAGRCGDSGFTLPVGEISGSDALLLANAKELLYWIIDQMRPGTNTYFLAQSIQAWARDRGMVVNRRMGGHGIGTKMHQDPNIYNTPEDHHSYATLRKGMLFCVEPFVSFGQDALGQYSSNHWTLISTAGKPYAFFEHMVKIVDGGAEILTTHLSR